jgi:hypothetical protein
MTNMNYIGLDVHKKTISYCVKDVSGRVQQEGKVGSTRRKLDCWMKRLESIIAKSLVPYRQCSAGRGSRRAGLLERSIVDTAICTKPGEVLAGQLL